MATSNDKQRRDEPKPGTLGTFAGVFTPSVLTILGIILFLRMGFVVGSGGLGRALPIILLANAISILTSISLSAIATNLRVKGGGDYYLISRTLGVEYGGALGLVLFLAQAVSIAFYAIGFGEAVAAMFEGEPEWMPQAIAEGAVAVLFVLAWLGSDWATRFQYVVMAVLLAAIVVFFVGGLPMWDGGLLRANFHPSGELPFWALFAIFFPAVTGFTQGVSLSGDLKDPGRSIPLGTFLAVGISLVVYLGVALVFAAALPGSELVSDYQAMRRIAALPWLIDAGVIAATLSSALASFLGAPRILQSLASDKVFPVLNPFAKVDEATGNPRRGVLLSCAIAFGTVALGKLNLIAPIVSMFFLISYGLLNYATYVEARAGSPSFRPRFRFFHKNLSLVGGLACLGAMLAINPTAGAVAVVVLFTAYQYLSRSVRVGRWADGERSRRFQRVREDLYAISKELEHPRYWRPVLLAFSDDAGRRKRMLHFASWLEGGSGFTTVVRLVAAEGSRARREREETERDLKAEIDREGFSAYALTVTAPDIEQAFPVLLQSYGLGPVRPNTVLFNWFDLPSVAEETRLGVVSRTMRMALRFHCNLVILGASTEDFEALQPKPCKERSIDVWYRDNGTGRLSLLLAYLMTRREEWNGASIRVLSPASQDKGREEALAEVEKMLDDVRITASCEIVDDASAETVTRVSGDASVVFLPFRIEGDVPTAVPAGSLDDFARAPGIAAFVLASQDIALDSDPEAGEYGRVAEAMDTAEDARKSAKRTEKDAEKAAEKARGAREQVKRSRTDGVEKTDLAKLEGAAQQADQDADKARRRAAKKRAKADTAVREAEELSGQPIEPPSGEAGDDEK